jgi:hypothetical protein
VIEPFLRSGQGHLARGDALQNVRAGARASLRIRKLVEQTTPQHLEEALFLLRGVRFVAQDVLTPIKSETGANPKTSRSIIELISPAADELDHASPDFVDAVS